MSLGGIEKISPEAIEGLVPMGIGEVIPEGIAELNLSCEDMGVSTQERISEKVPLGRIIFDIFPELIKKFSSVL